MVFLRVWARRSGIRASPLSHNSLNSTATAKAASGALRLLTGCLYKMSKKRSKTSLPFGGSQGGCLKCSSGFGIPKSGYMRSLVFGILDHELNTSLKKKKVENNICMFIDLFNRNFFSFANHSIAVSFSSRVPAVLSGKNNDFT